MSDRRAHGGHSRAGAPNGTCSAEPPRSDNSGLLLERVPAILYTADAGGDGAWHYVSPQIEEILGFTPEQWCADPGMWASRLHPGDERRVLEQEQEFADGTAALTSPIEYRLLHRDGHPVWVRDDALLRESPDGIARWHGVMSDITEQKNAEAELALRAAQQAAVARLGEHALQGASLADLMHEAVSAGVALLSVEVGAVVELILSEDAVAFRALHGLPGVHVNDRAPAGLGSQSGYALLSGRPAVVTDWATERRFERSEVLNGVGTTSGLTVVIEGRRGPFGALGFHSYAPRLFKQGDVDFVQSLANVLGDVVERQLTDDDIRHRALHDPLTGLPNRLLFLDRLGQATERQRRRPDTLTAVLALDLDRFKLVNESLGHRAGDELLAAAAPRLRQIVRSSDTVARFSGDEFGILLEDIAGEQDAIDMAERIAGMFNRPFVLDGNEHFVTISIGIALAEGGERAEDLVRDADAAMHRAKERGRARYELYDEALRGRALSRLRVENDLRRALERDELVLHYQPLVSLRDRAMVSVEALVRWEHPERGRIAPVDFIPVAEENGLIEPIGRWVLEHACRQAAEWCRERPDAAPLTMSVNLSAAQVANRALADTVSTALRVAGLDPSILALELTESMLVADNDELSETLVALKALGVRLVLDDFGTGYSSLSYLTRLPLDALKVDRSFVDGLGTESRDTAVTEAIVAMSRALSLRVVGEGAETEQQVAELARLGCDLVQGFHFSRPVPAAEITRMLAEGPAWLAVGAAR
ncbi:MAG TPA: EAL domain-containing protein [Solirubrobacteraceae bacterium]|jgi:diguanylate cyclase (GGDEF)-like protein/PAS domain S-box-containing protein